jgi:hypothetical protein
VPEFQPVPEGGGGWFGRSSGSGSGSGGQQQEQQDADVEPEPFWVNLYGAPLRASGGSRHAKHMNRFVR